MRLYAIRNIFQSTHPVRGATFTEQARSVIIYISIHAPRAGCDILEGIEYATESISIHAPRAGCDLVIAHPDGLAGHFNPRTPCGVRLDRPVIFGIRRPDFNPRTPCGVRPAHMPSLSSRAVFQSTHPVRGATSVFSSGASEALFQSTHPVRGATNLQTSLFADNPISIHAPRAGCDVILISMLPLTSDFNPRTPCGVRPPRRT